MVKAASKFLRSIATWLMTYGGNEILFDLVASLPLSVIYNPSSSKMTSIGTLYLSEVSGVTSRVVRLFAGFLGTS